MDKFAEMETPFYYYDTDLLRQTLSTINAEAGKYPNYHVRYAKKANATPQQQRAIYEAG